VHRADLAQEVRAELAHHGVGLQQLPPEQVGSLGVVGGVLVVLGEGDGRVDLVGSSLDRRLDAQRVQRCHRPGVELSHRHRLQPDAPCAAVAAADQQAVVDEVELDVEGPGPVRDR
jgi:hypothetical protein